MFRRILVITIFFLSLPVYQLLGQSGLLQGDTFNFEDELLTGFNEDGRIKVLLLTLAPSGMTETAAEQIAQSLELNLFNTNHFTVVGPAEWNAQLLARDPSLADCHDIACGILIGKLFNADKVLVGRISAKSILDENAMEIDGFSLSMRLLDVINNTTDYADQVYFTDENMQDELFRMAVRISENTLLQGRVLAVDKRNITVDLGRAHGLKIGQRVVVFEQLGTTSNVEGEILELEQKNTAIAEIVRLNDMSADAILVHRNKYPKVGDMVKTFINAQKRVDLIAKVRRELDVQKRLQPKIKRQPLTIKPSLVEVDTGKEKWLAQLKKVEDDKKRWMYITIGSAIASALLLSSDMEMGGNLAQILPIALGGAALYSGYNYLKARSELTELRAKGQVKGYTSNNYFWFPTSKGIQFSYIYRF